MAACFFYVEPWGTTVASASNACSHSQAVRGPIFQAAARKDEASDNAEPRRIAVASVHAPFRNCFFVQHSPMGVMDTNLFGSQEPGVLGACLLGGSLKSWVARCEVQTLHLSEGSWKLGRAFFPDCLVLCYGGGCSEDVSQLFLPILWHSLICLCAGVTELVSGFLSEGSALCIAAHLVPLWQEESSGDSFVTILFPPPPPISF